MSLTSTGARVVFRIQGQKIAFASAINITISHEHQPVEVLDQLEPFEYAETAYKVNFSANGFRIATQSAVALGIRPRLEDILVQPELTAELIDRVSGETLELLERVKCTQETLAVDARGLANVTLDFVAIKSSQG